MSYLITQMKLKTMRRVHVIYACRVVAPLLFEAVVFGVVLWGITVFVSIKDVVANAPSSLDMTAHYGFFLSAIANTEITVYGLFSIALILFGVVIYTVWKIIRPTLSLSF